MFKKLLLLGAALCVGSYFAYKKSKVRFHNLEFLLPPGYEQEQSSNDDMSAYVLKDLDGYELKRIAICKFPAAIAKEEFKFDSNLIAPDKVLKRVVPDEDFKDSWNLIILDEDEAYFALLNNLDSIEIATIPYTFKIVK